MIERPTERELAVHAQLLSPNRHDKRRLQELGIGNGGKGRWFQSFGYKEIEQSTDSVRLVKQGPSRFEEEFVGWVKIGDYDWIWELQHEDGKVEYYPNLHFKNYSGCKKLNIVALDENNITIPNPSHAAAFREIMGPDEENPFE